MKQGIGLVAASVLLSGCGLIINGKKQMVEINSNPPLAKVVVDGRSQGSTPTTIALDRNNQHIVNLTYPGYQTVTIKMDQKVSKWMIGNLIWGPAVFVGLLVDALTGGMYLLTPDQINEFMIQEKHGQFTARQEQLFVGMTKKVNPNWKKIGQMQKV